MLLLEHLFLTLNIYLHALLQVFTFGFYMTYIVFTFFKSNYIFPWNNVLIEKD